jgi:hypothetical protein
MHKSKRLGKLLLATMAIGALGAVGASSAMAVVHWSNPSAGVQLAGTLTASSAGVPTQNCTPKWNTGTVPASQEVNVFSANFHNAQDVIVYECKTGFYGELEIVTRLKPLSTTSVQLVKSSSSGLGTLQSPWGSPYAANSYPVGTFVNGSGTTPSTLTFNNAKIGDRFGSPVYISGTLKVTGISSSGVLGTGPLQTLLP